MNTFTQFPCLPWPNGLGWTCGIHEIWDLNDDLYRVCVNVPDDTSLVGFTRANVLNVPKVLPTMFYPSKYDMLAMCEHYGVSVSLEQPEFQAQLARRTHNLRTYGACVAPGEPE